MIAREGRVILIPLTLLTFLIGILAHSYESQILNFFYAMFGLFFIFCLNFFRDPRRATPIDKSSVVSPADGKIVNISTVNDPETGDSSHLVSIFLNVFNVHVNRVPVSGVVKSVNRSTGKFLAAFNPNASDVNEQVITVINHNSMNFKIKQIAGLIARRILCYAKEGSKLEKGGRLGYIRFGSRTDIILPSTVKLNVSLGQKVIGGETIIGSL